MPEDLRRLLRLIERIGRSIVQAPARWRARQWAVFIAIAAATLATCLEKRAVQAFVQRGDGEVERALASFANTYGSGVAMTWLGVIAYVLGRWGHKRAVVDTAIVFAAAGLWCWVLMKIGQFVLAERRPNEGGAMRFFAMDGHGVSGHASAAALLYWPVRDILARGVRVPVRRAVGAALIAWAVFVGWSRVWLGMHFVWNVVLGFAIGGFTGFVATHRAQTRPP
jgi:membrane-associated phospholipid phosphatase